MGRHELLSCLKNPMFRITLPELFRNNRAAMLTITSLMKPLNHADLKSAAMISSGTIHQFVNF
jgi:hypothetical protein